MAATDLQQQKQKALREQARQQRLAKKIEVWLGHDEFAWDWILLYWLVFLLYKEQQIAKQKLKEARQAAIRAGVERKKKEDTLFRKQFEEVTLPSHYYDAKLFHCSLPI